MKLVYVVFLMGAAAVGGGLVVRYSGHPVQIAQARSMPPTVVAPPIPPAVHMGPSSSVPVRSAPPQSPATSPEKPSALSLPVHIGQAERAPDDPPRPSPPGPPPTSGIAARIRIPPEPPAVIPLEHSIVPPPAPAPAPVPARATMVEPKEIATVPQPAPAPRPEPNRVTLRPGMLISVRVTEALSSDRNVQGDVFTGTLDRPLIADGFVIAERGARVRGAVIDSKPAGRVQGMAELTIQLKEINTSDGQSVAIVTQPWHRQGTASTGEDVAKVGGGAALGAIIGAAGDGDVMLTRGHPALIKPETSIPFRLDQAVEITERR